MKVSAALLMITYFSFFISWTNSTKENERQDVLKTSSQSLKLWSLEKISVKTSYPTLTDLNAKGLDYEIEIMDIYMGNFPEVPWQRDEILFGLLLNSYIDSFAKRCDAYLPADKKMLYGQECAEKQITKNGYGMIISETCIRYRKVPLNLYAAPEMARAKDAISEFELKWMGEMLTSSDGLGNSVKLMSETKAIKLDMVKLLQMNSCDSPGLLRFQENLRRYAHGLEPIKMENLIAARNTNTTSISPNQNMQQLLEDLVYQNSRQWNFNKYHQGSLKEVVILSKDFQGKPQKIKGSYTFSGFGGTKNGSVTLTFDSEGLPDCLYFYDFPTTCRPANRKIAMAYAKNNYATATNFIPEENNSVQSPIQRDQVVTNISPDQQVENLPFAVIEEPPIYPSCEILQTNNERKKCFSEKISQFVNKNFNSDLPKEIGLSGINRIIIQFRISPSGEIEDVRSRAPHPKLEQEATRVVNLLPRMTPGKQRGRTVGVMYSLPIAFNASENNTKTSSKNLNPSQKLENPSTSNMNNDKLRQLFKLEKKNDNN